MVSRCEWSECTLKFANAQHLIEHVQRHVDELRLLEDDLICYWRSCTREKNKAFVRPYQLVNHLRCHTLERPYECDVCHQKCSTKQMLDRHSYVHGGQPRYKCEGCGKLFALSSERLKCQDRHLNRTYPCPGCRKVFRDKGSLRKHKKAWGHTGEPSKDIEDNPQGNNSQDTPNITTPSEATLSIEKAMPIVDKPDLVPIFSQCENSVSCVPLYESNNKYCIIIPVIQTSACTNSGVIESAPPSSDVQSACIECLPLNSHTHQPDRSESAVFVNVSQNQSNLSVYSDIKLPMNHNLVSQDQSNLSVYSDIKLPMNHNLVSQDQSNLSGYSANKQSMSNDIFSNESVQAEDLSPMKYFSFEVSETPLNMSIPYVPCNVNEPVLTDLTISTNDHTANKPEDLSPLKYYPSVDMQNTSHIDMYYKCSQQSVDPSLIDLSVDHCSLLQSRDIESSIASTLSAQPPPDSKSDVCLTAYSGIGCQPEYSNCKYVLYTNGAHDENNYPYISNVHSSDPMNSGESNPVNLSKGKSECLSPSLLNQSDFLSGNSCKFEDRLPPISSFSSTYNSLTIDHFLSSDSNHTNTEPNNFQISKDGALDLTGDVEETITTLDSSHHHDNYRENVLTVSSSNRCGAIDLSRHDNDNSEEAWIVDSGFSFTNLLNSQDPLDLSITVVDACRNWDVTPWLNSDIGDRE